MNNYKKNNDDILNIKKERAERTARNPQTGENITIPARNAVTVKVGSKLKEAVK